MAKGTSRLIPPVPVKQTKEYDLTLNEQEALTLRAIINRVGGSPEGRRRFADAIGVALTEAGVEKWPSMTDVDVSNPDNRNSIYFK